MTKYHNVHTEIDGIIFDSKREAAHYQELCLREIAGEITDLELQPAYPVVVNGKKICTYYADFRYREVQSQQLYLIDVKGIRTATYRLKKKLVEALYGLKIIEV